MPLLLGLFFVFVFLTSAFLGFKIEAENKKKVLDERTMFSRIPNYIKRVVDVYNNDYSMLHILNYAHYKCNLGELSYATDKLPCNKAKTNPYFKFRYASLVLLSNGNMCYYNELNNKIVRSTCKPLKKWIYNEKNPLGVITLEDYEILKNLMPPSTMSGAYIPGLLLKGTSYIYGKNMEEVPYLKMGLEVYHKEGGKYIPYKYYDIDTFSSINEKVKYIYKNLDEISSYIRENAKYWFSQDTKNPYAFLFSASLLQYADPNSSNTDFHIVNNEGSQKYGLDTSLVLALPNQYIFQLDEDTSSTISDNNEVVLPADTCNGHCQRLTEDYKKPGKLTDTDTKINVRNIKTQDSLDEIVYSFEYNTSTCNNGYENCKLDSYSSNNTGTAAYYDTFGNIKYQNQKLYDFVEYYMGSNTYKYAWDGIPTNGKEQRMAIVFSSSEAPEVFVTGLYNDIYNKLDNYTDFKAPFNYAAFKAEFFDETGGNLNAVVVKIFKRTLEQFYKDKFNVDIENTNFKNPLFPSALTFYRTNSPTSSTITIRFDNRSFLVDNSSNINYLIPNVGPLQTSIFSNYSITFAVPIVYDVSDFQSIDNGNPLKGILYKTYSITTLN